MTVEELIGRLQTFPPHLPIMISAGFNGQGTPREINFGPTTRHITDTDAENAEECEDLVGDKVIILGYGCY